MQYISDQTDFQLKEPTIVTLGKFDGRHRGHQKLLRTMKAIKRETALATAIFTFSIAPGTVVSGKDQTVITTNLERRNNMEKMGIDYLIEYPFNEEAMRTLPEDFVKNILVGRMCAKFIVVGPDCSFGYRGAGNAQLLKKMAAECHFTVQVIEKEKDEERDISSTYIREELARGNVAKANELLGEPYAIHGQVVHGRHMGGAVLGFPTANVIPPAIKQLPRFGVYVSRVLVDGVYYRGVTNIGVKPTVEGENPVGAETYIFDLHGDIYGKTIEVQLLEFDRSESRFASLDELRQSIEHDKDFAVSYFEKHPEIILGRPKE